jgi:hypothetical protein
MKRESDREEGRRKTDKNEVCGRGKRGGRG